MHDTSSRVPMIARLPGTFAKGKICEQAVSLVDIGPTFTTVADADTTDFDGLPMQDVAAGKTDREYVYSQWDEGRYAEYLIASKDWSYFYSATDAREYCYHKAIDPHQQQLVAATAPFKRQNLKQLREALLNYLKESGEEKAYEEKDGQLVWRSYPTSDIPVGPDERLLVQDHVWADTDIPGYTD